MDVTLEDVAEQLYQLPAQEFTSRRDAFADQLRAGDAALAKQVAALPKPTASARALNIYVHERPDQLTELLAAGAALREAQQSRDAAEVRELTRHTHDLVRRLLADIGQVAATAGSPVSDALLGQVEDTLRTAMADDRAADAVRAGLLAKPLPPPGFGPVDLTGAVAGSPAHLPTPRAAPRPEPDTRQEQAVAAATQRHDEAVALLKQREDDLDAAVQAHEQAKTRIQQLAAELDQARRDERATGTQVRDARTARDEAAQHLRGAATKLEQAQR